MLLQVIANCDFGNLQLKLVKRRTDIVELLNFFGEIDILLQLLVQLQSYEPQSAHWVSENIKPNYSEFNEFHN